MLILFLHLCCTKYKRMLRRIIQGIITNFMIMATKPNHQADIKNPNKETSGTNTTHDKNQGNRGKQLNPNQKGKK